MGPYKTWKEFFQTETFTPEPPRAPVVHKYAYGEVVLPDDYPVHAGYVYIVDGIFCHSPVTGTVSILKRDANATEVRSCNLFAHGDAKIGDRVS